MIIQKVSSLSASILPGFGPSNLKHRFNADFRTVLKVSLRKEADFFLNRYTEYSDAAD